MRRGDLNLRPHLLQGAREIVGVEILTGGGDEDLRRQLPGGRDGIQPARAWTALAGSFDLTFVTDQDELLIELGRRDVEGEGRWHGWPGRGRMS